MTRRKTALRMFLVGGLGLRSANHLIRHFKEPEAVFDSTRDQLEALGIPPEVVDDLLSPKSRQRAEEEWQRAAELKFEILDILDPAYSPLLREIFDPPIVLLCSRRKMESRTPAGRDRGNAPPVRLRRQLRRAPGGGSCGKGDCDHFRPGEGSRRGGTSWSASERHYVRGFRMRPGLRLPQGEPQTRRTRGIKRRNYIGIPARNAAGASEFPDPQSNHRRLCPWV